MRKRSGEPVEVRFLTDPLCPWSWAMAPLLTSLRGRSDLVVRTSLAAWLPDLEAKGVEGAKAEWSAAAKAGARLDRGYWNRAAPVTSLIASAAVKTAEYQGARGEAYLAALRSAIFEREIDPTDPVVLAEVPVDGLKVEIFRGDLGVGRYRADDVLAAVRARSPPSEAAWWFGRARGLRSFQALAEDWRVAEERGLSPPAFLIRRGTKEAVLTGLQDERRIADAVRSVQ